MIRANHEDDSSVDPDALIWEEIFFLDKVNLFVCLNFVDLS
jgi:hypothetical protein